VNTIKTIDDAINYIHSINVFRDRTSLEKVEIFMEYLNNPHENLKCVHITGTNGKGSCVYYISNALVKSGYRVGIYTSPFIENFTERIRIGDLKHDADNPIYEIGAEDLIYFTNYVRGVIEKMVSDGKSHPTQFEVVFAIAVLYFAKKGCDICVIEVGMGGRLDATNVIKNPLLCVITKIGYDHMKYLGDTLPKIANEKAGIIKENCDVLLHPCEDDVLEVFKNKCIETKSKLFVTDFENIDRASFVNENGISYQSICLKDGSEFKTRMPAKYQIYNMIMSINACLLLRNHGINIDDISLYEGIRGTVWPGRFECVNTSPDVWIDGAHNDDGMQSLCESLEYIYGNKKIIFILGILSEKEISKMVGHILPYAKKIFTVTPPSPKAMDGEKLRELILSIDSNVDVNNCDTIMQGLNNAMEYADERDVICACGSLYYIGEIRKYFNTGYFRDL